MQGGINLSEKTRSNVLFNVDTIRQWQIDITKYIEISLRDINTATKKTTFENYP